MMMMMMTGNDIGGDEEGNGTERHTILAAEVTIGLLLSSLPALITVGLGVLSLLISSPPSPQSSSNPSRMSQYSLTTSESRNQDNDNDHTKNLRNRNIVKNLDDKTSKQNTTTSSSTKSNNPSNSKAIITTTTNSSAVGRLCFFFHIGCAWSFFRIVPPSNSLLLPSVSHFSLLLLQRHQEEDDGEHNYISKDRDNFTVLGFIVMAWTVAWTLQIVVGHWVWEQNRPNVSPSTFNQVSYLAMCQSVLIAWSS